MGCRRAVFLDRDGVLIRDVDLLTRIDEVRICPCAPAALRSLQAAGFAIVVVTNQAVIARGMISEAGVEAIHDWIQAQFEKRAGVRIDAFYVCPHHPHADVAAYRRVCECRKPRPGMLLRAAEEMALDLRKSVLVGDRASDIIAGRAAGCRTILVQTGKHDAPLIVTADPAEAAAAEPDHVCDDLAAATEIILREDAGT